MSNNSRFSENSEPNNSLLRASESSEDDFEDATDDLKVSEVRRQASRVRTPSIFRLNVFNTYDDRIINDVCRPDSNLDQLSSGDNPGTSEVKPGGVVLSNGVDRNDSASVDVFNHTDNVACLDAVDSDNHVVENDVDVGQNNVILEVVEFDDDNSSKVSEVSEYAHGGRVRILSDVTEVAGVTTMHTGGGGEPSKALAVSPGPGSQISPLKSNHGLPKLSLEFDKEVSGKSIVHITMNAKLLRTWIQYWADIRLGEIYEYSEYLVELFSIKKDHSELTLRIKMKTRQEGNYSQVTIHKQSSTKLRMESKKGHIDASSIFGKILKPMLWEPLETLSENPNYSLEIIREEGDRKCRVCQGEWVDLYKCSCCDQYIHKKCREKGSCKGTCKGIQVTLQCSNRDHLVKDHLDQSILYRSLAEIMRRGKLSVTKAALVKRNEEMLNKLVSDNKKTGPEKIDPVVTTRIRRLESIANENVAAEEARYFLKGDKSKEWAVGKAKQRRGKSSEPGTSAKGDTAGKANTESTFEPEVLADSDLREIIRLNMRLDVCSDQAERTGSWLRAVTTAAVNDGDLGLPGAVNQLRDNLVNNIPHLGEAGAWVDSYFGGDHAKYVKYVKENTSPLTLDNTGMMICAATAKVLKREILLYKEDDLSDPKRLPTGPGQNKTPLQILYSDRRFWAMIPAQLEILGEVNGMEEPSQAAGKYRQHRKRGPTLAVKSRPVKKGKKDELRRRDEKAKSDLEIKLDATQVVIDSLKCDAGELRDKMRNMESREKTQNQYIACLERRFVNLCGDCRAKDSRDTAFTPLERYSISRILELLERQEERMTKGSGSPGASGGESVTDSGLREATDQAISL